MLWWLLENFEWSMMLFSVPPRRQGQLFDVLVTYKIDIIKGRVIQLEIKGRGYFCGDSVVASHLSAFAQRMQIYMLK